MLYLHKLLPSLFLPIGFTLVLVGVGLILRKRILCWLGIGILYFLSTGVVSGKIMELFEGSGGRREVERIEPADAIVVLSGMLQDRKDAELGEWSDAVDRFEGGVELFQAGKAPRLIFTGGHVPWRPEDRPEGEILKERAVKLGVPGNKIVVTGIVGNTAQEAEAVMDLIRNCKRGNGWRVTGNALLATSKSPLKGRTQNPEPSTEAQLGALEARHRIILVTSAFHMRRAKMLFERQGFEVDPFPVDFRVTERQKTTILSFLPKAEFLEDSEIAMREGVGILYYTLIKR